MCSYAQQMNSELEKLKRKRSLASKRWSMQNVISAAIHCKEQIINKLAREGGLHPIRFDTHSCVSGELELIGRSKDTTAAMLLAKGAVFAYNQDFITKMPFCCCY